MAAVRWVAVLGRLPARIAYSIFTSCLATLSCAAVVHAQTAYDGFDPGANNTVLTFAIEADGRILVGGAFTTLGGGGAGTTARNHLGRLNIDGSIDPSFDPGANERVYAFAVQPGHKIVVGGVFTMLGGGGAGTTSRHRIARVNADGTLDATFDPDANGDVYALALQPDGRILVAGAFTAIGGFPRSRIARLNADGSVDATFTPAANDTISTLALQPDDAIVAGGLFTTVGGVTRQHVARIHANGTLDTNFDPGANARVRAIGLHADGRIVVGGYFTTLGGGGSGISPREHLGRLNADGSIDATFDPGADAIVHVVTVQTDGRILVGGQFTMLGGGATTPRAHLGRLRLDGSVDPTFNPGADGDVLALVEQGDRSTLVGGAFTTLGGGPVTTATRQHVGRICIDGSVDTTFDPGDGAPVRALAVQPDGKIFVGLRRFYADGTLDSSFNASADGDVRATAVQPDGRIVVAGSFTTLDGQSRHRIGRLNADGSIDQGFADAGANDEVYAMALQPDGKILVGGAFTVLSSGGTTSNARFGRLLANGNVDPTFHPVSLNSHVYTIATLPDGRIVLGGAFGQHIVTVSADGSSYVCCFNSVVPTVNTLQLQANARLVLGGVDQWFAGYPSQRYGPLARLNVDGQPDSTFLVTFFGFVSSIGLDVQARIVYTRSSKPDLNETDPQYFIGRRDSDGSAGTFQSVYASFQVLGVAVQGDGKIVGGGDFSWLAPIFGQAVPRANVGRVSSTDAATQRLDVAGVGHAILTWTRGGAAPEVTHATFEVSTDGVAFSPLGNAARVPGGWRLSAVSLPTDQNLLIRARGYYSSGWHNSSASIVESVRNIYLRSTFTDDTLAAATIMRAVHITELRYRIDAQRAISGLAPFAWTDPIISSGATVIRAAHILDLREALRQVYVARTLTAPTYTDAALAGQLVKAIHIEQVRSALRAIE